MGGVGVICYGCYIPRNRISRKTISEALGWLGRGALSGEKAVANYDEDSLTMAVAAGMDCLKDVDRTKVEGLYFATTTAPYREKESAAIIATALDLPSSIRTADFADCLKAGTTAFLAACECVEAGGLSNMLVCASDCRLAKPGSFQEMITGDGAAAFLIGRENVIATLEGFYSVSYDFPDYWRLEDDRFIRTVEERFVREEGYAKFIHEAISGLLTKYKITVKQITKVAYPCFYPRDHTTIAKRLGFQPDQVQEPLLNSVGEIGTGSPLLSLVAMLEKAQPDDQILIVSYGNGAEALLFKVTHEIERLKDKSLLKRYLDSRQELTSYEKYLVFRGIVPVETGFDEEVASTRLPLTWRERKTILAFYGSRCKRCGTPQYPPQRICVNPECRAIGEMEPYRFSDKRGRLFSYTQDYASSSINPPLIYGVVDFEGGGRFILEITDCRPGSIELNMPVEMTFRKKYVDRLRGIHGYFWKARPLS